MNLGEELRLVVAAQPTVAAGALALLNGVVWAGRQLGLSNTGPVISIAESIQADVKAWTDALLANTTLAMETAGASLPPLALAAVPAHMVAIVGGAASAPIRLGLPPDDGLAVAGAQGQQAAIQPPAPDSDALVAARAEAMRRQRVDPASQANHDGSAVAANTLA